MPANTYAPVLGFAALSGTGKTTLLCKLLPVLKRQGLKVGMIKHAHHDFDIDQPGKDSYELRRAGAACMLVASSRRQTLIIELDEEKNPKLSELLSGLPQGLDLILVEGFKHAAFPKIELHRPGLGHPLLFPEDSNVIAIATDAPLGRETMLPVMGLNDVEVIADFVCQFVAGAHDRVG